jgi:hypothetical protein
VTNENLIAVLKTAQKEIATPQAYTMLEDTIAALRKEIAVKAAKSAGKQDLYRAMLAVINSAEKQDPGKKALHGAWIDDGKQYVSNRYMLIENGGTPLDLPALPDDVEPLDVQPIIKARAKKEYPDVLTCPTVAELKSGIAEQKALAKCNGHKLRRVEYHLGGGHVADAEYLRIAVQATGSTTIHAENRMAGRDDQYQVGELWFKSDDGTVRVLVSPVLLPVRKLVSNDATGFYYIK